MSDYLPEVMTKILNRRLDDVMKQLASTNLVLSSSRTMFGLDKTLFGGYNL